MKTKHNKKRNSAFLYEVLILEFAKAAFNKREDLRVKILEIIKESFNKNSFLYKELKLYKELVDTSALDELSAEKILCEVKKQREKINDVRLIKEQSLLTRKIKKILSNDVFSNFVPNFKNLATIAQIFNKSLPIKSKVLLENEIIKCMTREEKTEEMKPVDNLVFKSFTKCFNDEYGNLFEEQKVLLNKFITSFSNNGIDLKVYLNDEIGRLKQSLNESITTDDIIKQNEDLLSSTKKVIEKLENYRKNTEFDQKTIQEILKIQGLIKEIKSENASSEN